MLRRVFWILIGLLAIAAIALLAFTLLAGRLEKRVREAVMAAGKLGQYALEEKIGEGGMGAVYRGRHAMLRRPTAIKLLHPDKTSDLAVARFEREVQHTSQLNHPNTITIYDYGRTDEGMFYYAMEYLDGFSLQTLVERFGPQPDGRVIQILLQVCGSLLEAHSLGLIHRDIKPANIMLTRRGGMSDFVKLLDFGLVKATDSRRQAQLTAVDTITGTPLYLPPECIQDPDQADARSDLYSLGARGLFPADRAYRVRGGQRAGDHSPARREQAGCAVGAGFAADCDGAGACCCLACLEKSPADRPQSAAQLADLLAQCTPCQPWHTADARAWWNQYQPAPPASSGNTATEEIDLSSTVGYSTMQRKA